MLYAVLAAWLIAALGTAVAIRYAHRRELLDQPGERRSHEAPTPRGGGIAIVAAVLVVGIALWMGSWSGGGKPSALVATFLAGFTIVAAIGWMDDHRPLPAAGRLMVHLIAAVSFARSTPGRSSASVEHSQSPSRMHGGRTTTPCLRAAWVSVEGG